jgi:hypothetical protein
MSGDSNEPEKYLRDYYSENYEEAKVSGSNARKKAMSEFKSKYPYADMSKFDFQVTVSKDWLVESVDIFFKLDDGVISYDITSDTFKNSKELVRYLTAMKPKAWPKIWKSGGDIPEFFNLRTPSKEWGIHRYPYFQKAPNLGFQTHNFRVYINDKDYFNAKLKPITLVEWSAKPILIEYNRGEDPPPKRTPTNIRIAELNYKSEPYFAQICVAYTATFLSGISLKNLQGSSEIPNLITSIPRFHFYDVIRKFMYKPELMDKYDFSGMRRFLLVRVQSYNKYNEEDHATDAIAGWVNYSNSDYLHFIPYDSNGLTKIGIELLSESIESYVYAILVAQAKNRWAIVCSSEGKSLHTQEVFRKTVENTIVQSDVNVTISNMRLAISSTNVILNLAINPDTLLIPSDLTILSKPIPGYNNVLKSASKAMSFGVNKKVNYVGSPNKEPKKVHQEEAPTAHLNTLDSDDMTQSEKYTTPLGRPLSHPNIQRSTSTLPEKSSSHLDVTTIVIVSGVVSFVTLKYTL